MSLPSSPWKGTRILMALGYAAVLLAWTGPAQAIETVCVVDDHTRPVPPSWNYNQVGGEREAFGSSAYWQSGPSAYRFAMTTNWYLGMWYSVGHLLQDGSRYNPQAMFHSMIRSNYQARLTGVDLVVNAFESSSGTSNLALVLVLFGVDDSGTYVAWDVAQWADKAALTNGPFPKTFSMSVNPAVVSNVAAMEWVVYGAVGDAIEVDRVNVRVEMPDLSTPQEAFLTSLTMLLDNFDDVSGMVQDRSWWGRGNMENVTATAKLAKLLAMAIEKGMVDEAAAKTAITRIADTFINVIPRGPAGVNRLLPHFTANGGAIRLPDTEWASGDTAYAVMDLVVALQMIGDPQGQGASVLAILEDIDWAALLDGAGYFSHGYTAAGDLIPYSWDRFGVETLSVMLAALAGDGILTETYLWPPSANGSGFIYHAPYPVLPEGTDRWGNVWADLREEECDRQLSWYASAGHENPYLAQRGLFGLSAAEIPDGSAYGAYGTGGQPTPYNDGNHRVAVPHYAGLIAALRPAEAQQMWQQLKTMGLLSPLNNVESIAVNPASGVIETVNYLRGSWNLALQAEGWALSDTGVAQAARAAFHAVPSLHQAYETLMTPRRQTLEIKAAPTPYGMPAPLGYGQYEVIWGRFYTNSVSTPIDLSNGTRHVCTGWIYSMAGASWTGTEDQIEFRVTGDASLTWNWQTEHSLVLIAAHGGITGATQGWKTDGFIYDLIPTNDPGYVFDHWEVDGSPAGSAIPLSVAVTASRTITAVFVRAFMAMSNEVQASLLPGEFQGESGYWLATVSVSNEARAAKDFREPFWYAVRATEDSWLLEPDGVTTDGCDYVDLSEAVTNALSGVGNGDSVLNPGECVAVTNVAVYSRYGIPPQGYVWALWSNPPTNQTPDMDQADTDGDGILNYWEDQYAALNRNNPFDANEDLDQDGYNNLQEFIADTDPAASDSFLRAAQLKRENNMLYFEWAGGVSATQYLEHSENLIDWTIVATNSTPTAVTNSYGFLPDAIPASGYLRIRVGPR
ncbi:MAG: hypothetical protein V1929_11015 [bacterium]